MTKVISLQVYKLMNKKEERRADEQLPPTEEHSCLAPEIGGKVYAYYTGSLEADAESEFEEHLDLCIKCHKTMLALDWITVRLKKDHDEFFDSHEAGKDFDVPVDASAEKPASSARQNLRTAAEGRVVGDEQHEEPARPMPQQELSLASLLAWPLLKRARRRKGVAAQATRRRIYGIVRVSIICLAVGIIAAFLYFKKKPAPVVKNEMPNTAQPAQPEYAQQDSTQKEKPVTPIVEENANPKSPRTRGSQRTDQVKVSIAYLPEIALAAYENIDPSRGANEESGRSQNISIYLPRVQRVHLSLKLAEAEPAGRYIVSIENPYFEPVLQEPASSSDGETLSVTLNAKKIGGTRYYLRIFRKGEDPEDYLGLYSVLIKHPAAKANKAAYQ